MTAEIRALEKSDDRETFCSGDEALDLFFHRYAGLNQFRHHVGVTCVAIEDTRILGFVTISPATLLADDLPEGRRMPPYPVPVLRLARLAVGLEDRGIGLGRKLLRFTIEMAEKMRDELGCVGIVVDAKPGATGFYGEHGFIGIDIVKGAGSVRPSPVPMFLPIGAVPRR